jgi:DNA-binding MarR family transcriptional regulator
LRRLFNYGLDGVNRLSTESNSKWTFLSNHGHVIILLGIYPKMTVREMAGHVGITERAVLRILADLEKEEFITVTRLGRQNEYRVNKDSYLRHPLEESCKVSELVDLVKSHKENGSR